MSARYLAVEIVREVGDGDDVEAIRVAILVAAAGHDCEAAIGTNCPMCHYASTVASTPDEAMGWFG
jgi:hypothetical protein